ncbi:18502_t:CDS:2, partial [Rhizophagus irregularis]
EELKSNIMEFINAPIGHNNFATKSHPKACYTSRLLDFTSKKLNEILESENLNDCVIKDLRTFDENIIKLNEILESEDSQASVKTNEILVSENLSDCIIKNLGSSDWSSTSQHSYPQLGEPTSPENDSENILHNTEPLTVLSSKDIFFLDIDDIYPFTYSTLHFEDDEMEETYDNEDYFQQLLNTALNAEIEEVRLEGNNIPSISNTPLTPIQDNIPLSSPDTVPISENLPKDGKKTTLLHANIAFYLLKSQYIKVPVRHLLYKHSDSIPNADDYPFLVPYFTMDSNHKKQIMTKLTQASSSTGPSAPPNNYNPIPDVFIPKKYRDIIPKDLIYMNDRYVTPGSREWFTYMYNVDESYYPPESRTPRYNAKGKYVARTPIYRSEVVENYVPSHIVEKSQLRRTEKLKADALTKEAAYHGTTSKYYNSHANIVRSVTNASNSFHECMPKYLAKRQQNHEFGFSNATLDKNLNKFLKNNNI